MPRTPPLLTLILILIVSAGVTAQTSQNSIPKNASPVASKPLTQDETIALLIADVGELRETRDALIAERDAAVTALEEEKKVRKSVEKSYAGAEQTIATLNSAIGHLENAIKIKDQVAAELKEQRDSARKDAKRANKRTAIVTTIFVARELARIFF